MWKELIDLANRLQPPSTRDRIYKQLGTLVRKNNWYTKTRTGGVLGFLLPSWYERCDGKYPRLKPRGPSESQLGVMALRF